jgi:hypothetical protein
MRANLTGQLSAFTLDSINNAASGREKTQRKAAAQIACLYFLLMMT